MSRIPAAAQFSFVSMATIMSVDFKRANSMLFPERPARFSDWRVLFARSSAVHFFSKTTSGLACRDDPRYCAYALLGPRFCPASYYSNNNF